MHKKWLKIPKLISGQVGGGDYPGVMWLTTLNFLIYIVSFILHLAGITPGVKSAGIKI